MERKKIYIYANGLNYFGGERNVRCALSPHASFEDYSDYRTFSIEITVITEEEIVTH